MEANLSSELVLCWARSVFTASSSWPAFSKLALPCSNSFLIRPVFSSSCLIFFCRLQLEFCSFWACFSRCFTCFTNRVSCTWALTARHTTMLINTVMIRFMLIDFSYDVIFLKHKAKSYKISG
ncbi:MAG: hypothetical protein A2Y87_05810 [Bacteroidetes bacterium RBG_13_46_8]|nr:MAG: hypothetical protein A2Y87_05810 [Bacteroidetes bacterium RBG_13_46_8]